MAVSQMAAVREIHSQHGGAGLERGHINGDIGLRAGMRLDVRVFRAEKLFRSFDGEPLDAVYILAAAVISLARVAFCIFVGEDRTRGFQHSFRNEIFGRDEFESGSLPAYFVAQCFRHLGIDFVQRTAHPHQFRAVVCHFIAPERFAVSVLCALQGTRT